MSKREIRALVSLLLPCLLGTKQKTALFTVVLLGGLTHANFDGELLPTLAGRTYIGGGDGGNVDFRHDCGINFSVSYRF